MKDREVVGKEIVQAFYRVYNSLGHGFLEKIYENSLALELRSAGFAVQPQAPIDVFYKGEIMGKYFADLLVEGCIIVEIKAVEHLVVEHEAQLLHYLRATNIDLGFLINFGPKPQIKRKIYQTARRSFS